MTRRERLERKVEKREEWAEKATDRSAQHYEASNKAVKHIPMGQPVLVGHHSERGHRAAIHRAQSHMDHSVEEMHKAQYHQEKAKGLERLLSHTIFSDDDNATEALEDRIAKREAAAEQMVEANKAWRKAKGNVALFASLVGFSEDTARIVAHRIEAAYSWEKQPFPGYQLSNLRAKIRTDKERLAQVKTQQARGEKAEQAGGVVVEDAGSGYCRVTFAEKPDRSVLNALKAAGFWWKHGSWAGKREQLPTGIA